jgi:hypothetical protein
MNDVARRQKALAVVRDMDTDAIISMLQTSPSERIPFPAMRDLETVLQTPQDNTTTVDFIKMMTVPTPDYNRLPTDRTYKQIIMPSSSTVQVKDNPLRVKPMVDRSTISLPGEGRLDIGDIDVSDTQKENVDYLGKLLPNDGSESENHADDEGWM